MTNNRLFELRRARGISRADLAKRSGVSPRTIERYEQGRSDLADASFRVVYQMAQALGTDPAILAGIEK